MLLLVAIALAVFLGMPNVVHTLLMDRRLESLRDHAAAELGTSPSIDDATGWLTKNGFAVTTGRYQRMTNNNEEVAESGKSIHGEKPLAQGTLFWKPCTLVALLQFSETGHYRRIAWRHRRFDMKSMPASRFTGQLQWVAGFPLPAAMVLIVILNIRRRNRRHRNLCADCAYPIGQSPVCTECGAAVTAVTPKPSSTPTA